MIVYLLIETVEYEGDTVIDIFKHEATAYKAKEEAEEDAPLDTAYSVSPFKVREDV